MLAASGVTRASASSARTRNSTTPAARSYGLSHALLSLLCMLCVRRGFLVLGVTIFVGLVLTISAQRIVVIIQGKNVPATRAPSSGELHAAPKALSLCMYKRRVLAFRAFRGGRLFAAEGVVAADEFDKGFFEQGHDECAMCAADANVRNLTAFKVAALFFVAGRLQQRRPARLALHVRHPLPIPGICRQSSDGEGTRRWFVTTFPFVCVALSAVGSSLSTLAQPSALGAEQGQPHMRLAASETGWRRGAPMPDYARPAYGRCPSSSPGKSSFSIAWMSRANGSRLNPPSFLP